MSYTSNKGVSVTWKNLTISVEQKKESVYRKSVTTRKEIIHNVDGSIEGGTLVAILGASGSGKSTLMSVLADRVPKGLHIRGSIEIGRKPMGNFVKYISGYVYQDDLFISNLTVFEHLNFAAKLRLDRNTTEETRKKLIFDILTELGLLKIAHNRIGTSVFGDGKEFTKDGRFMGGCITVGSVGQYYYPLQQNALRQNLNLYLTKLVKTDETWQVRKRRFVLPNATIGCAIGALITLSGGERKRLSIATELLTNPSLLFCDEPTTGLDSFTALKVVGNLEYLSKQKRKTIICSIHQPNEEIFRLFQQIILLTAGKIAFSGNCDEAVEFFKDQGFNQAEGQNPAEYLIKSLASVENNAQRVDALCLAYKSTQYHVRSKHTLGTENRNDDDLDATNMLLRSAKRNGPHWAVKLWHVTHRNLLRTKRDRSTGKTRFAFNLIGGLIVGVFLGKCAKTTQTGLGIFKGIAYMIVLNSATASRTAINIFPQQMPIFFREYANNAITPSIFYLSNILSMLLGSLFYPIPYVVVVYWLTNLTSSYSVYLLTFLVVTLLFGISTTFGGLASLACNSYEIADCFSLGVDIMLLLFTGILIKLSTIPIVLRWIRYFSWIGYAMESIYIINFRDIDFIECPKNPNVPCLRNGAEVLASFDFEESDLWFNITNMVFIYLFVNLLAYIALLLKIRSRTI